MDSEISKIKWSALDRKNDLKRLEDEEFDLVIIGGGITGAGIAREAALRGIKTALIEKNDFASGTSSRSSKMVHGGFRYLSQHEFKLVREATTERNWLRNHFSHNIRPLLTNVAGYTDKKISPIEVKIGLRLYDFISDFGSKFKQYKKFKILPREEAIKEEPELDPTGLEIMGQYYDTNVDDSRLTLETIKEAKLIGDLVALSYVKAGEFILDKYGKIKAIEAIDIESGNQIIIKGRQFVNATGIWTDSLLQDYPRKVIRPTKGVHILVPRKRVGNHHSLGLFSKEDGRFIFVLTRNEFTLIGTTDTDYTLGQPGKPNEDLDLPYCTKEDCDYLIRTVNHYFPRAKLTYDDIISTYAGIRPLVMEEGKSESDISRKEVIIDIKNGLTTICGGKLTTFRLMAENTLYHIIKSKDGFSKNGKKRIFPKEQLKRGFSKRPYLIDLKRNQWDQFIKNKNPPLATDITDILYQQYGKGAIEIVEDVLRNPERGRRFLEDLQFIPAEIYYILDHEFTVHLIDVLRRRTEISMKVHHKKQSEIAEKVADIMAEVYNWDENLKKTEIKLYLDHIKRTIWF
ncbi:MAG: glycerol-3-phosphate dehydrogenase/oxidase [Promethearchaeota archaeon]